MNSSLSVGEAERNQSPRVWGEASVLIPLYSLILTLSLLGNSLVMVTLLQHKRMRTPMNVLLLNLAISDLLLGVLCMPFTLTGVLLRNFIFGTVFCHIIPYLQAVSVTVSSYTLVMISFERFFGICYPLKSRHWKSLSHAYRMISSVWISAFIVTVPIAITSKLIPIQNTGRHKCREVWPSIISERIFNIYLNILLLVIPFLLMTVLYVGIGRAMWRHIVDERRTTKYGSNKKESVVLLVTTTRRSQGQNSGNLRTVTQESDTIETAMVDSSNTALFREDDNLTEGTKGFDDSSVPLHLDIMEESSLVTPTKRKNCAERCFLRKSNVKKSLENKKRIIRMLFVVVFEFFVCWTPLHILNTVALFYPAAVYGSLGMGGISALQLLAYCSCCCNPITYCFMNDSFRRAFLSAVRCRGNGYQPQSTEIHLFSYKTNLTSDKVLSKDQEID